MTRERAKTDPEIAQRLAELAEDVKTDPFPLSRIEDIAFTAKNRLEALKDSLPKEDLDSVPSTDDPLLGIFYNDQFVREDISPLMTRLLQRTDGIVSFIEGVPFGYANSTDGNDIPGVRLVVDSVIDDYERIIDDPADMQEAWDTAPHAVRDAMRVFGFSSKSQVMDLFIKYTEEYTPR